MKDVLTLEQASELIGLVYDSALEKSQWQSLVGKLISLCPGHVAAVTTFEDDNWRSSHVPTLPDGELGDRIKSVMDAAEDDALEQPADLHEVMFRRQPLKLGTLFSTRLLFEEEEFRNFEAYKTTMAPIGAGHYAGVHFSISEGRRAAIMVVENENDPTPKDHERICAILELIAPHTVRAARFSRALTLAKHMAETYTGFIDAIALPLIVVTRDGQMQMANSMGEKLLEAGTVVSLASSGRVALPNAEDTMALYQTIEMQQLGEGPRSLQVVLEDTTIALCICPFRPVLSDVSGVDRKMFQNAQLIALFVGARQDGEISLNLLRDAFDLSLREAEVCRGLLSGWSPAEIADRTDRAEKTVRNQIQAIHEKVGVNKSSDLVEALSVFRHVGAMYGG